MPVTRMFDPTASAPTKGRVLDTQDFLAVILVGYGESLYPFTEGTNVSSKALMPVGNVPIINLVLDWVIESGLTDILLLVPPSFHSSISNHLAENYSSTSHPRLRIDLKRHTDGEKEEGEDGSDASHEAQSAGGREGTARLLRRFRNIIKSDFVLLPCDVSLPPSISLASILDKHRASPEAVLTSVVYEPIEAVTEDEEKVLVGMDKRTNELLLIEPLEGQEDEDIDTRTSLMLSHPTLSYSTSLLDAHIYVLRRTILDLLATRRPRDLASVREQVVPWLIKGAWRKELHDRWASILDPPKRDIFADALAQSTTAAPSAVPYLDDTVYGSPSSDRMASLPPTGATSPNPQQNAMSASIGTLDSSRRVHDTESSSRRTKWKCQAVLVVPQQEEPAAPAPGKGGKDRTKPTPAEPAYLIRANSLAGYWELNRRFIRTMAPSTHAQQPSTPSTRTEDGALQAVSVPAISPSAQISPDSLLGQGTKVGEKASIKKCVVGRHCNIGRGAKLTGCVLWDFVTVEENARIENSILCSNVRIGEKAAIKDCEFGPGFEAQPSATLKGERLVAGQE